MLRQRPNRMLERKSSMQHLTSQSPATTTPPATSVELLPPHPPVVDPHATNPLRTAERLAADDTALPGRTLGIATPPVAPSVRSGVAPLVAGYEILEELGRGNMGVVYKARQITLNRLVALKMIRQGLHARDEELSRFVAEARMVASLQHLNIVQ